MRKDESFARWIVTEIRRKGITDERVLELLYSIAYNGVRRVERLAADAGISRRSMQREFVRAGLREPSQWIQMVNMMRTMKMLIEAPRLSVRAAARATGYPDPFTFSNQMIRIVGVRPTAAIERNMSTRDLIDEWFVKQDRRVFSRDDDVQEEKAS